MTKPANQSAEDSRGSAVRRDPKAEIPLSGWKEHRVETPFVEILDENQLTELNNILNWNSFSADSAGRRFGRAFRAGKRDRPQVIPDKRVRVLEQEFQLDSRSVLEFGCFEGHHTVALCQRAKAVTAVDGRVENVVKTIVRTAFFDVRPRVFVCDIENPHPDVLNFLKADICFHVGVLYHLKDPVTHLRALGSMIKDGIVLDTHYATGDMAADVYPVGNESFSYHRKAEHGHADVFSGMYDHSKWLLLDDILGSLREAGFDLVSRVETRVERNGPRVLIVAGRTHPG